MTKTARRASFLVAAFLLVPCTAIAKDAAKARIVKGDNHLSFQVGDQLVAKYHIGKKVAKPYFWPVNAPGGVPITRGWPMTDAPKGGTVDHKHQKSLWFCHGDVVIEGMTPKAKVPRVDGFDFWSEHDNAGRIVCVKVGDVVEKDNHAYVTTWNEWRSAKGDKVLDEERTIHLYDLGDSQMLVLDIDLHASVGAITFADTKEGSMGVRVRDDVMEKRGGTMTNAEGRNKAALMWGHPSDWVDYSGEFKVARKNVDALQTVTAGVAIFDDPSNKPRACWHARNYGLLAANPFARSHSGFPAMKSRNDLFKVAKGDHLKLRYGVQVHRGGVKEGKVADAFQQFVKLGK